MIMQMGRKSDVCVTVLFICQLIADSY